MTKLQDQFTRWLNSYVYLSHGTESMKRHVFLKKIVLSFYSDMVREGYIFTISEKEFVHNFYRLVFYTIEQKRYPILENEDGTPDDFDWYEHILDEVWWDNRWTMYEELGDFYENPQLSAKIRGVLPMFMWSFINITKSRLTSMGDDSDSDDEIIRQKKMGAIDPYLLDQMNRRGTTKVGRWE